MGYTTRQLVVLACGLVLGTIVFAAMDQMYARNIAMAQDNNNMKQAILYDLENPTTCTFCNVTRVDGRRRCAYEFMEQMNYALGKNEKDATRWVELVTHSTRYEPSFIMPLFTINNHTNEIALWHTAIDLSGINGWHGDTISKMCGSSIPTKWQKLFRGYIRSLGSYPTVIEAGESCGTRCKACMRTNTNTTKPSPELSDEDFLIKIIVLDKNRKHINGTHVVARSCELAHVISHSEHANIHFQQCQTELIQTTLRFATYIFGTSLVLALLAIVITRPVTKVMLFLGRKSK